MAENLLKSKSLEPYFSRKAVSVAIERGNINMFNLFTLMSTINSLSKSEFALNGYSDKPFI